jgi:mannose/fructose/N-acetylgalactosamine-specific phosphotransferase system component IID
METWKVLLGLTVVFVVFTVLAEVTNTSLSSAEGALVFVGALFFSVLFYFTTRFGYRIGQRATEDMSDEE